MVAGGYLYENLPVAIECMQPLAIISVINLRDIYEQEGFASLKRLAKAAGINPQYLRQCATGWRGK